MERSCWLYTEREVGAKLKVKDHGSLSKLHLSLNSNALILVVLIKSLLTYMKSVKSPHQHIYFLGFTLRFLSAEESTHAVLVSSAVM